MAMKKHAIAMVMGVILSACGGPGEEGYDSSALEGLNRTLYVDLPGHGTVQSQTTFILRGSAKQTFWRGHRGWTRTAPLRPDGRPDWSAPGARWPEEGLRFRDLPAELRHYHGAYVDASGEATIEIEFKGPILGQSSLVFSDLRDGGYTLNQVVWRKGDWSLRSASGIQRRAGTGEPWGMVRSVPLNHDGAPIWSAARFRPWVPARNLALPLGKTYADIDLGAVNLHRSRSGDARSARFRYWLNHSNVSGHESFVRSTACPLEVRRTGAIEFPQVPDNSHQLTRCSASQNETESRPGVGTVRSYAGFDVPRPGGGRVFKESFWRGEGDQVCGYGRTIAFPSGATEPEFESSAPWNRLIPKAFAHLDPDAYCGHP